MSHLYYPAVVAKSSSQERQHNFEDHIAKQRYQLLTSGNYSDLTISCRGMNFKVHQSVVCSSSEFFEKCCSITWKKQNPATIDLVHEDPVLFAVFLYTIYMGNHDGKVTGIQIGTYIKNIIEQLDAKAQLEANADVSLPLGCDCQKLFLNAKLYKLGDEYSTPYVKDVAYHNYRNHLVLMCQATEHERHTKWRMQPGSICHYRKSSTGPFFEHERTSVPKDLISSLLCLNKELPLANESSIWKVAIRKTTNTVALLKDHQLLQELCQEYPEFMWNVVNGK